MLSIFPSILFLAPFSALLIRIALALFFVYAGWNHFSQGNKTARVLTIFEFIAALSLASGAWTQIGAILGAILTFVWLSFPLIRPDSKIAALLALVMCISLLVTGGGALAFDLPL